MKMSYWALILTFIACVAGGLVWSANHYHGKFLEEQKRADAAEQRADSTEAITENVLRTMAITNIIQEANQHAKQQIALESQRTQEDIKVAVADDDCASRPVPDVAADRLRKYADSIRAGSIPANLLAETPQPVIPNPLTYGDSLSLNVSLLSALGLCNRDKSDLRRLGEQKYNLHLNNNIH